MQLVFRHLFYTASGFGTAARELAFAMEDFGVNVKLDVIGPKVGPFSQETALRLQQMENRPDEPDKVLVTIDPHYIGRRTDYRKVISCTMFETTKAPAIYAAGINLENGLIAPNRFNREAFRNAGVTVPIEIAQYGVDADFYSPEGARDRAGESEDTFVFLSVFGWSDRKGPDVLVKAFLDEFDTDEPVVLIIKTHGGGISDFSMDWYHEAAAKSMNPRKPRTRVLSEGMRPEEMAALYRGADCFVLPTRGEGVGLPILESMASAVPVIATGWSSHMEFLGPDSGYLIPYKLVPAHPLWYTDFYQPDMLWADPDGGALQTLMRRAYTLRDEARAKGQHGRLVARHWTWKRSAEQFIGSIERITGRALR